MKLSRYNLIKNFDGVNVFFNAMTCALAVVDDNFISVYNDVVSGQYITPAIINPRLPF